MNKINSMLINAKVLTKELPECEFSLSKDDILEDIVTLQEGAIIAYNFLRETHQLQEKDITHFKNTLSCFAICRAIINQFVEKVEIEITKVEKDYDIAFDITFIDNLYRLAEGEDHE